jgi:tetratricopeptide (TPR) repeat protein
MTLYDQLALLEQAGLIQLAQAEPELEYLFRHALLQETVYHSLLKSDRRALHRMVAQALEDHYAQRPEEAFGLLAYHYQRAEVVDKAREYLLKAAEQAAGRFANEDALRYYADALALTHDPALRFNLLAACETLHDLRGERAAQQADVNALADLAETLADDARRAEAQLRQASLALATSDYDGAYRAAQRAVALGEAARRADLAAAGEMHLGMVLTEQGDYASARERLARALALARANALLRLEADCLRQLGAIAYHQSDFAAARAYFEQSLALYRRGGDLRGEARALNNLGGVAYSLGDFASAQACLHETMLLYQKTGDRRGEGVALGNLGLLADTRGDHAQAEHYYREYLRVSSEIGDRASEGLALTNLGTVHLRLGRLAEAEGRLMRALAVSREIGERQGEGLVLAQLSLLAHLRQDDEAALSHARHALELARALGDESLQARALTHLGYALTGLKSTTEAAEAYEQALALRRKLGQHNDALEPLAGLARLALSAGALDHACAYVEIILDHLTDHPLGGTMEQPFRVHLTCYQVLHAAEDSRAAAVLQRACEQLRTQAATLDEPARRLFLELPAHRELLAEQGTAQ